MNENLDSLDLMDLVNQIEMCRALSICMHEFLEQPENREYVPSLAVSEFLDVLDSIV